MLLNFLFSLPIHFENVEGVIIIGYEIVNIVYHTFSHNHLELFMCNKLLDIYEEVEEESNIKNKLICNILH